MTSINGKSILVVDDDAAMLRALSNVLSGEQATVSRASRAEEALRCLAVQQGRFDLVIADLPMPGLGGKSVLEAIMAAWPEVPIIIITALSSPELHAQCLRQGAAAFLEKPVDTVTLLAAIKRVLAAAAARGGTPGGAWPRGGAMKASSLTAQSRAKSDVDRPPLKSLFCERFGCPPAKYRKQAFRRCLYPHARLLAPLILLLRPGFFHRDLGFIEYLGHIRHLSDAVEAASEFHDKGGFENEFAFTVLKIRVSGSRAIKLARELFRPRRSRVRGETEPA